MASLTPSSQLLQEKYDIFISFRGSDTRHGFLSHLTKQLRQEGIDVYVDERLERGDEISSTLLEAIGRSMIALVIFSKNYASSRWCLEELVKIMECKRVKCQIVIPVFYNVDPSHVRHQEGSYADAFAQHEEKFKDGLLQVWKSVLKETANISGHHHSPNFHDESDLINGIVKDVLKRLEDKDTIEPKSLIGFEEILATIESFMKVASQDVGVLGIWGKGGIGKTTLAHAVFDKIFRQFDSSCFVSNVREESKKIGLACLLEKILCVLLNEENLTMKGRPNNKRRLRRRKVLLVLDDVDSSGQLQYLIEENLSLGPNSKVIITSRDRQILVSGGVHVVHEIKELSFKESLQLFCQHAFKQAYPKMGYERLSTQAIQYAKGLPLALKVLGSHLNSRDAKSWESALKKLRKYPNVEIQNVLRVSYDGLDIPEKRIFLDIAFFFRGGNIEDIIRVLDACDDLYVDCGIDRLLDKTLITISRDNRVEIHDLLQEMAEDIVREESRENPGRRSRLNDAKEIQDVLNNRMGTGAIEGITLNPNELDNNLYLSADTFQKMSNLRYLNIKPSLKKIGSDSQGNYAVHLPDGLVSFSNKLRYLCWEWYPLESLPLGFSPKQLVEIHMPFSKAEKLWDDVQDLMNLKIIDLSYSCKLKELPDFTMAQKLETMNLNHCENLCSIHPSILSLPKLVALFLSQCRTLKNLHGDNHLKSLKYLSLNYCSALEEFMLSSEEMLGLALIRSGIKTLKLPVGRFNKLEKLYLGWPLGSCQTNELSCLTSLKIFSLTGFKERLDKLNLAILFDAWRSLEELHLIFCEVMEIPDNISVMTSLKCLRLRGSYVKSLPNCIKHLSKLKLIDLGECSRLRSLPELPPSIARIYADGCTALETIIMRSTMFEHDKRCCFFSWVKALEWGLDGYDMTEFIYFKVMQAIYNNKSNEVKVCYPGSTIPMGFKYSHMEERSITIDVAPSSSSDHLLGFASCCIVPPLRLNLFAGSICRKFHFEDEEIDYEDERDSPIFWSFRTYNVFVWYDPLKRIILKGSQGRRYEQGTTFKFACGFFIRDRNHPRLVEFDDMIKGCGIWPIYASDLQKRVQQIELKLEEGIGLRNSSGPSEIPIIQVAQHKQNCESVRRSTLVRQRTWDNKTSCSSRNKRSRNE